jgi:hypothetical protein
MKVKVAGPFLDVSNMKKTTESAKLHEATYLKLPFLTTIISSNVTSLYRLG